MVLATFRCLGNLERSLGKLSKSVVNFLTSPKPGLCFRGGKVVEEQSPSAKSETLFHTRGGARNFPTGG